MRAWAILWLVAVAARADVGETNLTAQAILDRVQAARAVKDFSLKARLFVNREQTVPVDILVHNAPTETRTLYRSGPTEWLVVQPVRGTPRFYRHGEGETTGVKRAAAVLESQFSYYDLGLPFLQWHDAKRLDDDRVRGQDCHVIEVKATGEPYRRAKLWIHREYYGLLRAELFDENDSLVKRLAITSFKRVGAVWIPRGIEVATVLPQQALPAAAKSRLEIYDGDYDTRLPAEWFAEDKL